MLIRVNGGSGGIKEYLIHGIKSGRALGRDELDDRVVLLGDLDLSDSIISAMENAGDKYYHVTLSFFEDSLPENILRDIATEFVNFSRAAYRGDELNFYVEAHIPRIKSYQSKSGEIVLRKPHIHLVSPKINLLTGKVADVFGSVRRNIDYIDAFQEYINSKYGLASPKDRRRTSFDSESSIISRQKNDDFSGPAKKIKQSILDEMIARGITSQDGFKKMLESMFPEVKLRNAGKPGAYWNVKPEGAAKGTNLKEFPFSDNFIRMTLFEKADFLVSDKQRRENPVFEVAGEPKKPSVTDIKKLKNWNYFRSREIKLLGRDLKLRNKYKSLETLNAKFDFLIAEEKGFYAKLNEELKEFDNDERFGLFEYGRNEYRPAGGYGRPWWEHGHAQRGPRGAARLADAPALHNLPGLSTRSLDVKPGHAKGLLQTAPPSQLDVRRGRAADGVRRSARASKRLEKPTSLPAHFLRQAARKSDRERLKKYAMALEAACSSLDIKAALEKAYGLPNFHVFTKGKDGRVLVMLGDSMATLDAFLADHMHLEWPQSLDLLRAAATMRGGQICGQRQAVRVAEVLGFKQMPMPGDSPGQVEPTQALYFADADDRLAFEVADRRVGVVSLDRYAVGAALAIAAQELGCPLEISGSVAFVALAQDLARDMHLKVKVVQPADAEEEPGKAIELDDDFDSGELSYERPRGGG